MPRDRETKKLHFKKGVTELRFLGKSWYLFLLGKYQ